MAHNRLVLNFSEIRAQLRKIPPALAGEGAREVEAAANGAAVTVRSVYGEHRVTGHLQASVGVEKSGGPFGALAVVKATDPIAWLFDNGSQARHWASGKSTGTMWGKTPRPPTHVFVRTMIGKRRTMYERLKGVLTRAGLVVTGTP